MLSPRTLPSDGLVDVFTPIFSVRRFGASRAGNVAAIAILAIGNYLLGRLGLRFSSTALGASPVWPALGFVQAVILLRGLVAWPGIALGIIPCMLAIGAPPGVALQIGLGDTLGTIIPAYFLLRRREFGSGFPTSRSLFAFFVFMSLGGSIIGASVGVSSFWLWGEMPPAQLETAWLQWFVGDVLGSALIGVWLLAWLGRPLSWRLTGRDCALIFAYSAVALAVGLLCFGGVTLGSGSRFPVVYLIFPLLIWSGLRFGIRGASATSVGLSIMAIWEAARGVGPFASGSAVENLFYLQLFLGVSVFTGLVLAATVEERDRLLRMRDDFISIASHELKTPLTPLKLRLALLRRQFSKAVSPGPEGAKLETVLQLGEDDVSRIIRLVNDMLDTSRVAAGKMQLTLRDVDFGELVSRTVNGFRESAGSDCGGIRLDAQSGIVGCWDPDRIQQIVDNLLNNAIQYGAGKPIEVRVWEADRTAKCAVRDFGIGIAQKDLARIFERFERLSPLARKGGLGLGLYVSRQLALLHGGRITVQSALGEGSVFTLELPMKAGKNS